MLQAGKTAFAVGLLVGLFGGLSLYHGLSSRQIVYMPDVANKGQGHLKNEKVKYVNRGFYRRKFPKRLVASQKRRKPGAPFSKFHLEHSQWPLINRTKSKPRKNRAETTLADAKIWPKSSLLNYSSAAKKRMGYQLQRGPALQRTLYASSKGELQKLVNKTSERSQKTSEKSQLKKSSHDLQIQHYAFNNTKLNNPLQTKSIADMNIEKHDTYLKSQQRITLNRAKKLPKRKMLKRKLPKASAKNWNINCTKMFLGDKEEIEKASNLEKVNKSIWTYNFPAYYTQETQNCSRFMSKRRYINKPISKEEQDFPIAYALSVFTDIEYFERLFRAIYQPQNYYCIHIDSKAYPTFFDAVSNIIRCFPNAFLTSERFSVTWGSFNALQQIRQCMVDLYRRFKNWKYFINLTGQEFPLRTNGELVRILKAYNGANDIMGVRFQKYLEYYVTRYRNSENRLSERSLPILNLTYVKGEAHLVASHAFVNYVLHDVRSLTWWHYLKEADHVCSPCVDEYYFQSLAHSPQLEVPGAFTGPLPPEDDDDFKFMINTAKPSLLRWKNWYGQRQSCPTTDYKHWMCIISPANLPNLYRAKQYFVNKLTQYTHPIAYQCLEELHYKKIKRQLQFGLQFDVTPYSSMPFVTQQYKSSKYF